MNTFSALLAPFTWKPPSISPEFTPGAAMRNALEAATLRQPIELFGGDVVRERHAREIELLGRIRGDVHDFGQHAGLQLGIRGQRPAEQDDEIVDDDFLESLKLDRDRVAARVEIGHAVRPVGTARPRPSCAPVSLFVTVTVAPGTAASDASVTVPVTPPNRSCASSVQAINTKTSPATSQELRSLNVALDWFGSVSSARFARLGPQCGSDATSAESAPDAAQRSRAVMRLAMVHTPPSAQRAGLLTSLRQGFGGPP